MKTCTRCGQSKPFSEFNKRTDRRRKNPHGFSPICKPCQHVRDAEYRKQRGKDLLERKNWLELLRVWGMTQEQYEEKLKQQSGVCALCQQPEKSKRRMRLAVDHDHLTGKIRGLLCYYCNRYRVGMFEAGKRDDEEARSYVERYALVD